MNNILLIEDNVKLQKYISAMFSNSSLMCLLVKKSILIVLIYAALQMIFYFICRRRYLNEVLR